MKKQVSWLVFLLIIVTNWMYSETFGCLTSCCRQASGRSKSVFLDTCEIFSVSSPLAWFSRDRLLEDACPAASVLPFGIVGTTRGERQIARRFGLEGSGTCTRGIHISNAMDTAAPLGGLLEQGADVQAIHLNINTIDNDFRSTIFFAPETSYWGAQVSFFTPLYQWSAGSLWMMLGAPFGVRKNRMNLHETSCSSFQPLVVERGLDSAPYVASATEAFSQSNWHFGKIDGCITKPDALTASGCGDIELTVGYAARCAHQITAQAFGGIIFPGDSLQTAEWVYQPLLGNGGHAGVFAGAGCSCSLLDNEYVGCTVHAATDFRYLCAKRQYRTFDLVGKPWSRYMGFFPSQESAVAFSSVTGGGISGVNHLTRCVCISPGLLAHTMVSLEFAAERGSFVFGLQGTHTGGERVKLPCRFDGAIKSSIINPTKVLSVARTIRDTFNESDLALGAWPSVCLGLNDIDWSSGLMESSFDLGAFFLMRHTSHLHDRPIQIMAGLVLDGVLGNRASQKWGFVCSCSVGW